MKHRLIIIIFSNCIFWFGTQAQNNESPEKYKHAYDSLANIIQNDSKFFIDLQKIIEINDSSLNRLELAIKQPFDSIGKILTSSYTEYTDEGENKVVEEGNPIYILETLFEYKKLVEVERKYQSEINQYFENLKLKNKTLTKHDIVGTYLKVESSGYSINNGDTIPDIDSTLLVIRKDSTYSYIWSPMFGPKSNNHIKTNGKWNYDSRKLILNSEYQQDEWQYFEEYKAEYGDSITKVFVQTYDSLIGFFQFQFIGVLLDTLKESSMIFADKESPKQRCIATFNLPYVDKIIFYGDFGRMPIIEPKEKNSNYFVLQYNLSTDWDYQYMKNLEWDFKGDEISIIQGWGERMILKKIKE